jgi:hypothetical protein
MAEADGRDDVHACMCGPHVELSCVWGGGPSSDLMR